MAIDLRDRAIFVETTATYLGQLQDRTVISWAGGVAVKDDEETWQVTDLLGNHTHREVAEYIFDEGQGHYGFHGVLDS